MIVCLCKAVSCSTVRRAIADGADSLEAVGRACGAGTDCGACHAEVEALVHAAAEGSGARRLPVLSDERAA